MIINHNIPALNTYRQLGMNQNSTKASMEKLSSGLRINRAGDDAAGLAISEKMRGQIRGLNQASRNSQDSISLIQTAEGALNETHNILQRMRQLAVQASNDTNTAADRNEIQKEINQLTSEINRIGNTTEFNTKKILNGNVGDNVNATRGVFDIKLEVSGNAITKIGDTTISASNKTDILEIAGEKFTYVSGGTSNPAAGVNNKTFHDVASLVDALKNSTAVSDKYDVQLTSDGNLRLTQKFGHTASGGFATNAGVNIAGNAAAVDTDYKVVLSGAQQLAGTQALKMQIGANQGQSMQIDINDMRAAALGISTTALSGAGFSANAAVTNGTNNNKVERALDVTSHESAAAAITAINNAIEMVSAERSKLGSFQNRLEHTIANLDNSAENLQAAESRVRDVDMANEIMQFTRSNILSQASQTMLAQANQAPQAVLQLLG